MDWKEEDHPRNEDGEFVKKFSSFWRGIKGISYGKLSQKDYKIIYNIAAKKYGGKQLDAGDFTDTNFVIYHHNGYGDIVPYCSIPIAGNEELILIIEEEIENADLNQ